MEGRAELGDGPESRNPSERRWPLGQATRRQDGRSRLQTTDGSTRAKRSKAMDDETVNAGAREETTGVLTTSGVMSARAAEGRRIEMRSCMEDYVVGLF